MKVSKLVGMTFFVAAGALLMQGFQCTSTDVAIARKSINAKDYAKARTTIEKALAENPKDCEATLVLGDIERLTKNYRQMSAKYSEARECVGIKPEQVQHTSLQSYNVWVNSYNQAITAYNSYVTTQQRSTLEFAAASLDSATWAKPEFSEPYILLGAVQEILQDTASAEKSYQKWYALEQTGFEKMQLLDIPLGTERGAVLKKLGTPVQQKMDSLANGTGVVYKDKFDAQGSVLYIFSEQEGTTDAKVVGWTFNPPAYLTDGELWRARTVSLTPIKQLALINSNAGKKQTALDYMNFLLKTSPNDRDLSLLRLQIMNDLGKGSEALVEARKLVNSDQRNVMYKLQYAQMLTLQNNIQEANEQYKAVLALEPLNDIALYALAASFKNAAVSKQRAEFDKMDKNPKYEPNLAYLDDLKTAAEYFQKMRQSAKYKDDLLVMEQLINIYEVAKETAKVKSMIAEFEALESKYSNNKDYWLILEGVYARGKNQDKMKAAAARAAKL